ncbi:oxidoreductase [Jeongeupia sp. HS-3]|uniref:Gfo/Idh/MocA family oxidoreductase n=1 Tax=Jeongeupia sp. HS-3 TaxID=1009682 RepID=UPI0018A40AB5|nr:Gfo/Idh/MocA family oxidoreductase [Jeongeupia sp. HS-3]BCL74803.1 oxidoreductase [Jeongeupia sp. HS-3]
MSEYADGPIRLGIIGCATGSHGRMWAKQWQSEPEHGLIAARVWDEDIAATQEIATLTGASVAPSAASVADGCDGVLIATLDPARYLALARPHLEAGRRVFFNRPFAGSLADARAILRLADQHGASVYSASALLHTHAAQTVKAALAEIGTLRFFTLTGPTDTADWYLPHLYACLFSTLGPGLARIIHADLPSPDGDPHRLSAPATVTLEYAADSAVGAARGVLSLVGPGSDWYGFTLKLYGSRRASAEIEFDVGYALLFEQMHRFFSEGTEPVSHALLLEQLAAHYATLDAARRGVAVPLPTTELS